MKIERVKNNFPLCQAPCQVELDNWVNSIHSACAAAFARHRGKTGTLHLLQVLWKNISSVFVGVFNRDLSIFMINSLFIFSIFNLNFESLQNRYWIHEFSLLWNLVKCHFCGSRHFEDLTFPSDYSCVRLRKF